jgi:integral membrane protein (TIGR01906 family)
MRWIPRVATGLFVVALPLLLITTNVRFLAGEVRFYERGFRAHDAELTTGLPLSELDRSAAEIVAYFENDARDLRILVNRDGEETGLYTQREIDHMRDVKSLMRAIFRLNEITLAYVLTYVTAVFLWAGGAPLRRLALETLGGLAVGVLIVVVAGGLAAVGFEQAWSQFHAIFFSAGSWQFNTRTDRLIQMFPEPFWLEETYILAALTLAEASALALGAGALLFLGRGRGGSAGRTGEPGSAVEVAQAERVRASWRRKGRPVQEAAVRS